MREKLRTFRATLKAVGGFLALLVMLRFGVPAFPQGARAFLGHEPRRTCRREWEGAHDHTHVCGQKEFHTLDCKCPCGVVDKMGDALASMYEEMRASSLFDPKTGELRRVKKANYYQLMKGAQK